MTRPDFLDFLTMAREWLKTTTGYANPTTEQRLAEELSRVWELGVSQAIEAAWQTPGLGAGIDEAITSMRALLEKPTDPRAS
jgi:hypothetical protein